MFKKISLLAVMALSVIAMAAPVAKAEWLHNGAQLEYISEIPLTGNIKFVAPNGFGSFECHVSTSISASPGNLGTVMSFTPRTSTCVGVGFLFSKCKLKSHLTTLPWAAVAITDIISPYVAITNATIHYVYEGCSSGTTTSHFMFPVIKATPDNHNAISSFSLSGTATNGAVVSGTLEVTGGAPGTYGIST